MWRRLWKEKLKLSGCQVSWYRPECRLCSQESLFPRTGCSSGLPAVDTSLQRLISAIYTDYARSLKNLGFKQGAALFASKAGAAGKELLAELESPKQEPREE